MKKKSMKKRTLAVLLAIAMFITYTPVLSYALTEETEGGNDAAAEAAEVLAVPEAETEEPEEQTSDSATIDSLLLGLEPAESENETVLSESKAPESKALKSKAALRGNKGTNVIKAEDTRHAGLDRFDTAKLVAEEYKRVSGSDKFENVVVAYGQNYPDALSGVYLANKKHAPILLVKPAVEDDIANYISSNIASDGKVYLLGGTGAVSSAFENKIKAKGIDTVRLGGKDRYATNLEILKEAGVGDEPLLVCTGTGYADSLSASAAGKPIFLVGGGTLSDVQKNYIDNLSTDTIYLIGGTGVVNSKIEAEIRDLGYDPERLFGATRYETSTAVAGEFFPETKNVVLAYAQNFPDGLSGGPLALLEDAPIVLADSNKKEAARVYVENSGGFRSITLGGTSLISDVAVRYIMGRKPPYITPEKKYVKIQVGETAEIRIDSNYGTTAQVRNSEFSDVVSKDTVFSEKGLPIERYTVKGKQAGTAVLVLTDSYEGSGLVTNSVTIIVTNGEATVETLYDIIETTGYVNKNGDKTVEHTVDDKSVYFVNHSGNVEMVCVAGNRYTSMKAPLNSHTVYPTVIYKELKNEVDLFASDIHPDQYTDGADVTIRNPSDEEIAALQAKVEGRKELVVKNNENASAEEKNFVTSTFGGSMAAWDSAVEENYGLTMNDLGFTNY